MFPLPLDEQRFSVPPHETPDLFLQLNGTKVAVTGFLAAVRTPDPVLVRQGASRGSELVDYLQAR